MASPGFNPMASPRSFSPMALVSYSLVPVELLNFRPIAFAEVAQCIAEFSPMALLHFSPMPFA
jgi:hypothetical protein